MTRNHPVVKLLRSVPGLDALSDRALGDLAPLVSELLLEPGRVLTREGTAGREAFILLEGEADVFVDGEMVASATGGEFVGEMALLDHEPRCATVRARTPMRVLVIEARAFPTILAHAEATRAMATQLAQRLRRADAALA